MAGPFYFSVWLVCATLYPAYESFKAVKTKNTKNYVRWMMYWIVYATFSAVESFMDPILYFWLPFYSEAKILFILYLVSSSTRGSSTIYRYWIHPTLCSNEAQIDVTISKFKSRTVQTLKQWTTTGLQRLGYLVTRTALTGGGGLVQTFQRSVSMMDLSSTDTTRNRKVYRGHSGNIIEENDDETLVFSPHLLKSYKSEEYLNSPNPSYASLKKLRSPDLVRSNESVSSGYGSDIFAPTSFDLRREETCQEYRADIEEENRRWEDKLDNIMRAMKESKQKLEGEEIKIHRERELELNIRE